MEQVHDPKTLIYVVDPMCSWCWGFSPVFEEIMRSYQDQVGFHILMGGLRPGNTERFDETRRSYILSHWHAVHKLTGQPFNFTFQMGSTFTYDTEPASRAVVVVRQMKPSLEATFLKNVQEAFYVDNADVTKEEVLAGLAHALGVDRAQFFTQFYDSKLKQSVWEEFDQARQLGVNGFPALLGRRANEVTTLTHGYQPFQELHPKIDEWLQIPVSAS